MEKKHNHTEVMDALLNGETAEFTLFEMVHQLGELLNGDLHIIDGNNFEWSIDTDDFENQTYRVYHKDGYCFDITKEAEVDEDTGDFVRWNHTYYASWDDFKKLDVKGAIELINKYTKTK